MFSRHKYRKKYIFNADGSEHKSKKIHIKNNKNNVVNFYEAFSYIFFLSAEYCQNKNCRIVHAIQRTLLDFIFLFLIILLANKIHFFFPLFLIDEIVMFYGSRILPTFVPELSEKIFIPLSASVERFGSQI